MTLAQAQENPNILQTVSLLTAYCFDLRGLAPMQLINEWLRTFSALWIRLAVIEALYLGRYKAISVEHLLEFWQVKGQPNFHFSPEFEQMISQKLPKSLVPARPPMDGDRPWTGPVDKAETLKIPGVINPSNGSPNPVRNLPNAILLPPCPDSNLIAPDAIEPESPVPDPIAVPTSVLVKPRRTFSPSIEQFIPIAAESDLLSKLQSVLHQGSIPVNS